MGILLGDNILNPLKDTKKKKFLDDLDDEKKKELQTFAFSDGNEEVNFIKFS